MATSRQPSKSGAAWTVFFTLGLLLVAYGVYLVVLPSADPDHWKAYTRDPDVIAYLAEDFRATGGMMVAFGVLTSLVAVHWFRAGDRWAWYAFWIFPLFCAWEMATTWAKFLWLMLLLVTAAALLLSHPRFKTSGT